MGLPLSGADVAPHLADIRSWQPAIATYTELRETPGEEGHTRLVIDDERLYEHKNGMWQGLPRFVSPMYGEAFVDGISVFLTATNTRADAKIVLLSLLRVSGALTADEYNMATDMVIAFHAMTSRAPRPSRGFYQ